MNRSNHLEDLIIYDDTQKLNPKQDLNLDHHKYQGIPPPKDNLSCMTNSFISDSSILLDSSLDQINEVSNFENVSQIKSMNHDLKLAVKETLKCFKDASREFHSNSVINSNKTSILLSELENVKRALFDATEESRILRSKSDLSINSDDNQEDPLQEIYSQIHTIQQQLKIASDQLIQSEELIESTDYENNMLKTKLVNLEKSLNTILVTEEDESIKPNCKCSII